MTTDVQATDAQVRQAMVSNSNWGVANHANINYAEIRPIPRIPQFHLPFTTDCSGFATIMAQWSGAPDPNGLNYNGNGYTGTMLGHLPHIPRQQSQPGDLVVFGAAPGVHVVVLVQAGSAADPLVVSHGQQGDPRRVALSVEIAAHAANPGLTFLQLVGGRQGNIDPDTNPFLPLTVDGSFGPLTIQALQWRLGVTVDGDFGPDTKMALQRHLGVPADGDIGPQTIKALQRHVGVTQSGTWSPQTTRGLQASLNAYRF
jgi:peptidoglycan hydrolase-like protein with peptidoglycan-binding domain